MMWMGKLRDSLGSWLITFVFRILSRGPLPSHLSVIMDGNRRFAKQEKVETSAGHRAGSSSLITMLKYCCDLGVKYVSVYAFSIDNFKRSHDEVEFLMNLIAEKLVEFSMKDGYVNENGIRVYVIGNLKLASEVLQVAAEKVMKATANNTKCALFICVAYTSSDEIRHAVEECCREKVKKMELECRIKEVDIAKNMYMARAPDPDVMIRTSGETRLSNFLLWQTSYCPLYVVDALWPQFGFWQLVRSILRYQQNYSYLEKKKKLCS